MQLDSGVTACNNKNNFIRSFYYYYCIRIITKVIKQRREGKKKGKRTKRENPCIERGRGRACLPFLRYKKKNPQQ
jgi:hypothetical protein